MEQELLTPEEVAKLLKLSKYTIYEMVKRGELPATRVGRKVRILREDINNLLSKEKPNLPAKDTKKQDVPIAEASIKFMGSHDISLDYVFDWINQENPSNAIIPAYVGSMEGLLNLYKGTTDIAGAHLLDEETGEYNIPFVKRFFTGEKIYVVQFVKRNIGWIIPKGNPKNIQDWDDLKREDLAFINRQKGAGTRILLDYHLKRLGIHHEAIKGYDQVERTHFGIAASISRGAADFALGTESAALSFNLEFISLVQERYDFIVKEEFYRSEGWKKIIKVLKSPKLREKINGLGGYDVNQMGELIQEVF